MNDELQEYLGCSAMILAVGIAIALIIFALTQ